MHAISISALLLMTTGSPITQAGGDTVLLGHTAEIIAPWFACRRKSDVEFLKIASEQSIARARRYAAEHHCLTLRAGDIGVVDDASIWTHNSCIHIPGKTRCYWFPDRFIRNQSKFDGSHYLYHK